MTGAPNDIIDKEIFEQLLEMDDDQERSFSRSLILTYIKQAEQTMMDMDGRR
jgi:predicted CopG family antitoxin